MQGAIDELNEFAQETYTPSDLFQSITFKKVGRTVLMELGRFNRDVSSDETGTTLQIGTIPEPYRPVSSHNEVVLATLSGIPMYVSVNYSGNIAVRVTKTVSAQSNLYASISYLSQ